MLVAVSGIRDRNSNRILIRYLEDGSPNGSHRPNEITYVTNNAAGLTVPPYKIKFFYETATRPDPILAFDGGGPANELKRLERIEVQHNTSIVRQYLFAYMGSTGGQRPLPYAIDSGVCRHDWGLLAATQFTWTNSVASAHSSRGLRR
jgi:hypothetical protein